MPNAENLMALDLAHACLSIMVTHILAVVQSASKILTAIEQKHASTINVKIHVQEYVALMQNVGCKIMDQYVFA
jgi:hypothetical protein